MTNAPFAPLHGLPVALLPFDDARSTAQTARSSRAALKAHRICGGLPSAARRRRCVPAPFPPSLRLHSTSSASRSQTEAEDQIPLTRKRTTAEKPTAYAAWPPAHSQRDKTEGNYMATAETSRMLRVRSIKPLASSVPVLTFPPPPKPSPLGFHRAHLSLRKLKTRP